MDLGESQPSQEEVRMFMPCEMLMGCWEFGWGLRIQMGFFLPSGSESWKSGPGRHTRQTAGRKDNQAGGFQDDSDWHSGGMGGKGDCVCPTESSQLGA